MGRGSNKRKENIGWSRFGDFAVVFFGGWWMVGWLLLVVWVRVEGCRSVLVGG